MQVVKFTYEEHNCGYGVSADSQTTNVSGALLTSDLSPVLKIHLLVRGGAACLSLCSSAVKLCLSWMKPRRHY